jgi:hypothetical protein
LPDFSWRKHTKWGKIYQTAINYTKWPQNIPKGHKMYQQLPFKGHQNFTQIRIFGVKTNHPATLLLTTMELNLRNFVAQQHPTLGQVIIKRHLS